jgi:hypothetical protein
VKARYVVLAVLGTTAAAVAGVISWTYAVDRKAARFHAAYHAKRGAR